MRKIENLDYTGWTRRIDLSLREKHPLLTTSIYKISNINFVIVVDNFNGDFSSLKKEFDHSIKYITAPVSLSTDIPERYESKVLNISDEEIPSSFEGIPFTHFDLSNQIQSMHPEVAIAYIETVHDEYVSTVHLVGTVNEALKQDVSRTLDKLGNPFKFKVVDQGIKKEIKSPENPVFFINSSKSMSRLNLPFLRRDESLWFENINKIYRGEFKKRDLFFFDEKEKSCFINFGLFSHINLRNNLLLYDCIYCTLPILGKLKNFFKNQKITKNDFLDLVKKGRIKVLITQPEYRLEYDFLQEIYESRNDSIVSRRALAALCAIDIVSINNGYLFNQPEFREFILPMSEAIAKLTKLKTETIVRSLFWPQIALRASFSSLNDASSKRISNYGVNNILVESIPEFQTNDYKFEFVVNAEAIHIAHSLDATYFPFITDKEDYTDEGYALMMGNMLNFYKSANSLSINGFINEESLKETNVRKLSPLQVFETNEYMSIQEFEKEVSRKHIRQGFRSLIDELANLDQTKRTQRIQEYNRKIENLHEQNRFDNYVIDLTTDTVGLIIPFLASAKNFIGFLAEKSFQKIKPIRNFVEKIDEIRSQNMTQIDTITILSQLNRVARLKREYK